MVFSRLGRAYLCLSHSLQLLPVANIQPQPQPRPRHRQAVLTCAYDSQRYTLWERKVVPPDYLLSNPHSATADKTTYHVPEAVFKPYWSTYVCKVRQVEKIPSATVAFVPFPSIICFGGWMSSHKIAKRDLVITLMGTNLGMTTMGGPVPTCSV